MLVQKVLNFLWAKPLIHWFQGPFGPKVTSLQPLMKCINMHKIKALCTVNTAQIFA